MAAIIHTEQHENSTLQVRVFILLLALGTSAGAICLLVWAADQRNLMLIVFGLLSVGVATMMIYGLTLLCGRSDGPATHAAARRRTRVPASTVVHRPRPRHVIAARR